MGRREKESRGLQRSCDGNVTLLLKDITQTQRKLEGWQESGTLAMFRPAVRQRQHGEQQILTRYSAVELNREPRKNLSAVQFGYGKDIKCCQRNGMQSLFLKVANVDVVVI